jgi:uridine kinase
MSIAYFEFGEIERKIAGDPRGYLAECDHLLNGRMIRAAAKIASGAKERHVVLLAGPSGSGKTTSASKLAEELELIGVGAHVISMDDYFLTLDPDTHPRNRKGEIDYESPACLDIPLLNAHFAALNSGEEVSIPRFSFIKQAREEEKTVPLRLKKNEVAIFEGIHALNPQLLGSGEDKWRVYASARANVRDGHALMYKGTWLRLTRRLIRDSKFRGWCGETTMRVWANIRRGEKAHISPYKDLADIKIDTALGYEISVLRDYALPILQNVPADAERAEEMRQIAPLLERFPPLPCEWVSKKALVREFIGVESNE